MDKSVDAFRTISEVADDLDLPPHVLRFWETKFPAIAPLKRAGGRRYYRPADVEVLRTIRRLLYDDGYTIKGVQRLFSEGGGASEAVLPVVEPGEAATVVAAGASSTDAARNQHPANAAEPTAAAVSGSPVEAPHFQALGNDGGDCKPALQTEAVLSALELLDECEDILARSRTVR